MCICINYCLRSTMTDNNFGNNYVHVLFQKTKPDDVSKLVLSKAKDWKYILQQVRILFICILDLKFTFLYLFFYV